jgi:serine/threonine-protein kinase PRP4
MRDERSFRSERSHHDDRTKKRSRSRSHDKKRDRDSDRNRNRSRSRSRDRKRDRGDRINDPADKYDKSKKSHRHDDDRDDKSKKSHRDNKSNGRSKSSKYDNDEDDGIQKKKKLEEIENYDDLALKEIEDFITEENIDEVQEAERLALERKKRREEILQKHNSEKNLIILPPITQETMESNFVVDRKNEALLSASPFTSESLAAMAIADTSSIAKMVSSNTEITNINDSKNDDNSTTSNGDKLDVGISTETKTELHEANEKGISKIASGNEEDVEALLDLSPIPLEEGVNPVVLRNSSSNSSLHYINNGHAPDVVTSEGDADAKFIKIHDERRAEKSAIEMEAHNHRESMPFDMFSSSPSDHEKGGKINGVGLTAGRKALREALMEGEDPHLQSNWDDGEGYYKPRIGEMIGDQYQTMGVVGKGVFSIVIKCRDIKGNEGEPVAIKVIRNNDTMRKAAEKERVILSMLCERDPENRRHCVKLLAHFEFRNHVALVFDYQQMNLRETLKKFGKDVGINIGAVRMYARQLLVVG